MLIADDLEKFFKILPDFVREPLEKHHNQEFLIEVVMDLGRRPEARFPDGPEYLSSSIVSWHDLNFSIKKIGYFSGDNRAGIESTLHRISSIRNRKGNVIGLTCRVGRAVFGTISIIRDLLEKGNSLLLLGKPGIGKTTAIREIARVLADEMEKRVVIIDTSNEIAGDGDIPHPAIGRARRMQVTRPELQHQVMIEAVENHMPEVIIIDEIGTELEALAARTIAERGVQLVGTAHGNYLESLIKNPILSDLIGGVQYVTLGDDEAKRRGSQKSILERKTVPAFQIAIEIHERHSWVVHEEVDKIVDQLLQGSKLFLQRRKFNNDGSIYIECESFCSKEFMNYNNHINKSLNMGIRTKQYMDSIKLFNSVNDDLVKTSYRSSSRFLSQLNLNNNRNISLNNSAIILYVYGINIKQIESIIDSLKLSIILTMDLIKADMILALKSYIKTNSKIRRIAKSKKITIYTIHNVNLNTITRAFKQMLSLYQISSIDFTNLFNNRSILEINALLEVKFAIEKIIFTQKESVQLLPQFSNIRKLQYNLINFYNLKSSSFELDNRRKVIIYSR
uniref:R3H domain-containing protein n=1 Tax=Cryptopleura ramosa TaxID=131094 RepID=A0A4D6WTC3_9FLOR|nr:hypothetical protein [Cryptopleura ramosa]